jgi:hypothetical protein
MTHALMTRDEWERMHKYTCSMPTDPRPGFVYATGPHKRDSDPSTDPWYRVEVVASEEAGYVDHIPTRIILKLEMTGAVYDANGC